MNWLLFITILLIADKILNVILDIITFKEKRRRKKENEMRIKEMYKNCVEGEEK